MSIRKNTIINLTGSIIPLVVMLVTVPLYLKTLGDVRYGVLALVWLLIGYFSFLEMGLGKATANHLAKLKNSPDSQRSTIFWTALLANGAFGLIAGFILWLIGNHLLTNVLKIPDKFLDEALSALPWLAVTLPLALVSSVLSGALEGRNKFLVVNMLQVASNVVFQIVPLLVAYLYGPSLSVVIPAAVLSRALMNIPFLVACHAYVPMAIKPRVSLSAAKSLLSYGGWVAVSGVIVPILETFDRFMIGVVLGAQAVTHYILPHQLVTKIGIIPISLSRALFPRFSSDSSVDSDHLATISLRALVVVVTTVVIGGIALFHPFMRIWIGKDLAAIVSPLGMFFFVGAWVHSLAHIPYHLLQGKGKPDIAAKLQMLQVVPYILLLWLAMHHWGIMGAAFAWVIRVVADAILLFIFSGMMRTSTKCVVIPMLMISVALAAVQYTLNETLVMRLTYIIPIFIVLVIWIGVEIKQIQLQIKFNS